MGLLICKCSCCCYNFCPKKIFPKRSSVGVAPVETIKFILLGGLGSGKTEVGCTLSGKSRTDFEPTNGIQHYQLYHFDMNISITEIGGNPEMQKLWHHYFLLAMGIIFCIDMSPNNEGLDSQLKLFHETLAHPFVQGKPVLLVATKTDLLDEGVQLYDIENALRLDELTPFSVDSLRLCYFGKHAEHSAFEQKHSLLDGLKWISKFVDYNYEAFKSRIRIDTNIKFWQETATKIVAAWRFKRKRYKISPHSTDEPQWDQSKDMNNLRPYTAPAKIFTVAAYIETSNNTKE